ncbi:MAG: DNA-directed RNA polymerase subunit alpha [Deinococcales bacterium]
MQNQPEFIIKSLSDRYGEFVVEPLPRGYGVTLGNPLRRILLSSIPGTAVTSVYIEDVLHEFSTIEGVKEDVMQIILNLKELVVRLPDSEPATLTLRVEREGRVTAADLEAPIGVEVINKQLHIATLTKGARLVMEVRVEAGDGYVPAEVHATKDRINSIPVDAIYTPVQRVAYRVEDTRVGQETDLDRLILRIWTDGSINPQVALDKAVDTLRNQLNVFKEYVMVEEIPEPEIIEEVVEEVVEEVPSEPRIQISLESLDLSSRVLHSLQEEGIDSVDALLALSEKDLKKVGGVGDKSLEEIKVRLVAHGLKLRDG